MNVRAFNQDGEESELRMSSQNESFLEISKRFNHAIEKSPSEETEIALQQIVKEVQQKTRTDYEKMLIFQCQREIARSLIKREKYQEAIPFLLETLKIDQSRTNLWADLAICAQMTQNADLYRAAQGKVQKIRPELNFVLPKPEIPPIKSIQIEPEFINYTLKADCFRHFLTALEVGNKQNPYSILAISLDHEILSPDTNTPRKYGLIPHIPQGQLPEIQGKQYARLGGMTFVEFLFQIGAELIANNTLLFDQSVHIITTKAINKIAELKFREAVPAELSKQIIDLSSKYVFDSLTPNARLFIAELASVHYPQMVSTFLTDVMRPYIHRPNAILRIAFATLEGAIRENRPYSELEKLYQACERHLNEPLAIPHASRVINKDLLEEKKEQIDIMRTIDNHDSERTSELAAKYFSAKCPLQFLSLKNVVKLFLQFDYNMVKDHLINFLRMLPSLIKSNPKDIAILTSLFQRFIYEMNEDCVTQLNKIFLMLTELNADKNIRFACALAIAYGSKNYPNRSKLLATIHNKLSDCCYLEGGKFLEILIESLINEPSPDLAPETKAFGCYFSDCALTSSTHESNLTLRCSPFMQQYYNHLRKLEEKGTATPNQLFTPYLLLWMHYRSEKADDRVKRTQCLHEIDGWSVYRIVKRKENMIAKTAQLPKELTTPMLLEEMLREGQESNPAARVALAKIIIKQYITKRQQEANQRITSVSVPVEDKNSNKKMLEDALKTLDANGSDVTPYQKLIRAIILYFNDNKSQEALNIIKSLGPFDDKPRKEARRLYWTMRLLDENGLNKDPAATLSVNAALNLMDRLNNCSEFNVLLYTAAGKLKNDANLFKKAIDTYCKSRIVLPQPYVEFAKRIEPNEAYKVVSKCARTRSMNINNFFHFDFKVPFLMGSPDDLEQTRRDLLQVYVDCACKSGNFTQVFTLINPNNKADRKLSRVFKENRFVYGIDRTEIFVRYTQELVPAYEKSKKKDIEERSLDALWKSVLILDMKEKNGNRAIPENLVKEVERVQKQLLEVCWKKLIGENLPEGATVDDLFVKLNGVVEEEEDDEEEDGDFVDSGDDEEEDGGAAEEGAPNEGGDDDAAEEDEGEEDDDDANGEEEEEGEAEEDGSSGSD
ncbi:hypothetical protein TVAG_257430 [Trichomonas vaginalis G3]|uniref:TPR Domain containing protein n=1 Tax=Trichomonas vaginalis (strain ATCC PRA-98 / G3) TaxID=412133 RepID=A2ELH7_TRIV3|nr:tetratricopeptide repeat domain domain-containing protein [Trichomonas vaginalis G3]EAY06504.1 hypothetical protein TVAG_257430 [Trichomonas vaginalis G3]KAI5538861.1 tetratricopeptide repeat domain domain-containing protein [Trichomonas vaginalis G3]|eukprot:XP_001318727.1 hypothetical protein [Trichomonas vaginalis G3]